jgi:putative NADH-flavin reductase
LGILAGTAIALRESEPAGSLIVQNLSERNHELVANLGLHNLLTVIDDASSASPSNETLDYDSLAEGVVADTRAVLESHENLVRADASNQNKFQDVISFLKNQVDTK